MGFALDGTLATRVLPPDRSCTIRSVVKTTLYLPDDLKRQVEDAARRRGISEAEFYRQALRQAVSPPRPRPKGALFASGTGPETSDLSSRVDEILAEGFGEQ
ncbi:MAG: CopG family transcriptional regulator [Pseudonocardiaceae bacterium]